MQKAKLNNTDAMLEKAIEIEGLVRIIRDGKPSPEIRDMICKKATELANWAMPGKKEADVIPKSAIEQEMEADKMMEFAETEEADAASEDDILLSTDYDDEGYVNHADSTSKTQNTNRKQPAEQRCLTNIKAYFSLNDRFLYARELFDGSMKTFDSTLKFLEGVSDYTTVEDYFYNELDWDRDNEYVKSFMDILKSKF